MQPPACPACGSKYLKHFGSGTQRVEQAIAQELPELRCLRFDSDTTRAKGAHRALLARFAQGEADVLVGTQMLTKGIDLPSSYRGRHYRGGRLAVHGGLSGQ
jgi:primosomal protein N' (replication factor Y)